MMNRPNLFASNSFFKPAASLLGSSNSLSEIAHRRSLSLDDSDTEAQRHTPEPQHLAVAINGAEVNESSTKIFTGPALSLTSIPRSPSPYSKSRNPSQSEDDEEHNMSNVSQRKPFLAHDSLSREGSTAVRIFQKGGIGQFLFGTVIGWRVYVGLLVFWVGGCQFGALLMNRSIMWTGTYKFPYPLTLTLLQLCIAHLFLLGFAALTRALAGPLASIGLSAVVAPSQAYSKGNRPTRYTGGARPKGILTNISTWFLHGSGGIAGGGLFEFQRRTAKHIYPVAFVFLAKTVLSSLSFAYAVMPTYMVSRIAVVPLTLVLTAVLLRQHHSIQTMSSVTIATLSLLVTSIRARESDSWGSVVAGVLSSIFDALYPIVLLRSYRQLVFDLVPQGDLLASTNTSTINTGTREDTRAYCRVLHYTSLLTIAMLIPLVIISGEFKQIHRNCFLLDIPWFWFLMSSAALAGFGVFSSFLLLIKATSPVTANFVSLPTSVFQIVVLSEFKMPAYSWAGAGLCTSSCLWFCIARIREGRGGGSI